MADAAHHGGIFDVVRSGCQWRLLPSDFPPWQTVYHCFRLFRLDGTWEQLNGVLREREQVRFPPAKKEFRGILPRRWVAANVQLVWAEPTIG